jgi:hypothetical protein
VSAVVQSSLRLLAKPLGAELSCVIVKRPSVDAPLSRCHLSQVKYPSDAPTPVLDVPLCATFIAPLMMTFLFTPPPPALMLPIRFANSAALLMLNLRVLVRDN